MFRINFLRLRNDYFHIKYKEHLTLSVEKFINYFIYAHNHKKKHLYNKKTLI